jgi:crotonobetainyl-CoA:carnitine CoA-transferase CaiB-like acyl-CoA transferase
MTQQPLAGITVLDLGQIYNGPIAASLAIAGAHQGRVAAARAPRPQRDEFRGFPLVMLNSFQGRVTLNLKLARRGLLRELEKVDAPCLRTLARHHGPSRRRQRHVAGDQPRLIYAAATGFGQLAFTATIGDGHHRAGDDRRNAITSDVFFGPPLKANRVVRFLGGIHLYGAIVTALFQRERTGAGLVVDVAMQDAVFPTLASQIGALHFLGKHPTRNGNRHAALSLAPYNVYRARDGHVTIICIREGHWRNLVEAMQRPELTNDPRFADMTTRAANMDAVDAVVEAWTSSLDKADVFRIAQAHDIICAPVQDLDDVLDDPHLPGARHVVEASTPAVGEAIAEHTIALRRHRRRRFDECALGADKRGDLWQFLAVPNGRALRAADAIDQHERRASAA